MRRYCPSDDGSTKVIPAIDIGRVNRLIIPNRQVFLKAHFFFFGKVEEIREIGITENLEVMKELPVKKLSTLVAGYDA